MRKPHVELAGEALDYVHGRERPGVIELDPGRPVDVQRPARGISERVVGKRVGLDDQLVEHAPERPRPRGSDNAFEFS
jgi:hypothetical protein